MTSVLNRKSGLATIAAISLAGAIAACGSEEDGSSSRPTATATASRAPSASGSTYRDGEYSATGVYGGLPSNIGVDVTLENDVIADVEVTPTATNPTSRDLQERFADAVPGLVEGRNIDDVELSRTAGSSDTPNGFNAALEDIKEDAAR